MSALLECLTKRRDESARSGACCVVDVYLVKTVQARLGHASASETLDTYSHLWPDSDERTREAIDSVLGRSQQVASCEDEKPRQTRVSILSRDG